ncbi:MAG TPA: hypothetical protein VFA26_06530 [Gemmataceae bacterium]|nr:hypothetical protein [Gemmataceae bacterium]
MNGNRFCGLYGLVEIDGGPGQGTTPARAAVQEVIDDLARLCCRGFVLQLAQVIDLGTMAPVEPWTRTMERVSRQAAELSLQGICRPVEPVEG